MLAQCLCDDQGKKKAGTYKTDFQVGEPFQKSVRAHRLRVYVVFVDLKSNVKQHIIEDRFGGPFVLCKVDNTPNEFYVIPFRFNNFTLINSFESGTFWAFK